MIPGLLGTLVDGFSFRDVPGCILLLDPRTLTLTNNDHVTSYAGIVGPTLSGETGGPIYKSSGINGKPAVAFDNTTSLIGSLTYTGTALSFCCVAETASAVGYKRGFIVADDGVADYFLEKYALLLYADSLTLSAYRQSASIDQSIVINTPFVLSVIYNGTTVKMALNGVEVSGESTGTFDFENVIIGRASTGANGWIGNIGICGLYGAEISAINRFTIERELSDIYGITIDQSPVNTVVPALSAAGWTVGQVASCGTGTWTNSPTTYAYQWQRKDGGYTNIPGATSSSYLLAAADAGKNVRCGVTPSNAFATGSVAYSLDSDLIL